MKFQDTLRKLAMIDEGFIHDEAGLGLAQSATPALDAKTRALLQVGASVATGAPAVCLEWSATLALAAGASEEEIADVLLAVAPVAGLGRVVAAAPEVAAALGYDIAAALEELDDQGWPARVEPGRRQTGDRGIPGEQSWTAVLRRQPVRIVNGTAEGGDTDMFEIICCDCGDDLGMDYRDVPPHLQLTRGPYPLRDGVAAYNQHLKLHEKPAPAVDTGRCTSARPTPRTTDDWS